MKTSLERLDENRVVLEVEVEEARVEQAVDTVYRGLVERLNIPGFRKGKAPRKVVELRVGRDHLYREAVGELMPKVFQEAVSEAQLRPVVEPKIDVLQMEPGKPLRFKAEVEVEGEVVLSEYKGLEVARDREAVTDEDVERELERFREAHAELEELSGRDTVETGDYAVIDYECFVRGRAFEGGAGKDKLVLAGGDATLEGLSQGLIGAKVGETKTVQVHISESYPVKDVAGQEAAMDFTVRSIKAKKLPGLDDELAKDAGDFATLEEFKGDIKKKLEEAAEKRADARIRTELVDRVSQGAALEIPEKLVERRLDAYVQDLETTLERQRLSLEEYLKSTGEELSSWKERTRERLRGQVRSEMTLRAVAASEGLVATEEELIDALVGAAPGLDQERVRKLLDDPEQRNAASDEVLRRKAVDFLVSHAHIVEGKVAH